MKLHASNGCSFTLTIECYEFPNEELGPTEDNPADEDFDTGRFLVVSHLFGNKDGQWRGEFPTMDTDQFARLIDWLDSIRRSDMSTPGIYFTERFIELTLNDLKTSIQVHLFDEFLPPWNTDRESVVLEFPLSEIDLPAAITSLREQAIQFPGRPPLPNAG